MAAVALLAAACSGGRSDEDSSESPIAAPSNDTATTDDPVPATDVPASTVPAIRYDIEPPVPLDEGVLGDGTVAAAATAAMSPEQLIFDGVDQGVWTQAEGAIATLQWLLGDLDSEAIPALVAVPTQSYSGVVRLGRALLVSGELESGPHDELSALLDRLSPPLDVVETVAVADGEPTIGPPAQGFAHPRTAPADPCIALDTGVFSELVAGDNCYAVKTYQSEAYPLAGYRLRTFYPREWKGTPKEAVAGLALDAMVKTATTLDEWAKVDDASAVFGRPVERGPESDNLGVANPSENVGGECAITILPTVDGSTKSGFQQLVAHEMTHCIQYSDMDDGGDWIIEGGAEYFSHWLYPEGGLGDSYVPEFDTNSRTHTLDSMAYEAWVWWQYLADQSSPRAVWEMQKRVAGGSPISDEPGMESTFNEFVIAWSGPGFADSAGGTLPGFEPSFSKGSVIKDSGETDYSAGALVAARWRVQYEKERRFVQERAGDGNAEVAFVEFDQRADRGRWTEVPPEIRTTCTKRSPYVVVATRVAGSHGTKVSATVELGECDPCLLGTWRLDNSSFDELIRTVVSQSPEMPPGVNFNFGTSGDYYLRFDELRGWRSWRTNYAVTVASQGFEMVTNIASIEAGTYGTDGNGTRLTIDGQTVESRATSNLPFGSVTVSGNDASVTMFGQTTDVSVPGEAHSGDHATAGYTCDKSVLTIALDGYPTPIRFDRVEDIPEPPTKLPD